MKKIMVSGLVLTFFLLFTSGLHAQKLYLGVLAGYSSQTPEIPDPESVDEFAKSSSLFYGARAGLKLMMFAVEGIYYRSAYELIQEQIGDVDWGGNDLNYSYIGVNVKFFPISLPIPPVASFRIFATAGYGSYTADIKDIDKDTNGGYNFGAGLELKLSKISVLVEGKYHTRSKFIIQDQGQDYEMELGNFYINAGVNIYF